MAQAEKSAQLSLLQRATIPAALLVWAVIASMDWLTTYEIYFSAMYLALVLVVAWSHGLKWALLFSVFSAANQVAIGLIDGNQFSSPVYFAIDISNWFIAYLIAGWMCARIRALHDRLEVRSEDLELRIKTRTAELEAANADLATFTYTAAHDLRTPLRAINSFSAILLQKNEGRLDEFSAGYLGRIQSSGEQMSAVIEGLLALIRESHQRVAMQEVDLSALAENVVATLACAHPERKVSVTILAGMRAFGDAEAMRIVMENLIGNAWKFTAKTRIAKIDVGMSDSNGRRYYFVRDNGAGFDARYAHKLFKPFQRLHHSDEFEGSGIGLARVKRIIQRHHGDIALQGEPGVGATASFSLGSGS
jgi:signal transduction histidine kinase